MTHIPNQGEEVHIKGRPENQTYIVVRVLNETQQAQVEIAGCDLAGQECLEIVSWHDLLRMGD